MRDGVDATVSVAESDEGDRVLYVNASRTRATAPT
jgi:hypothetical protein